MGKGYLPVADSVVADFTTTENRFTVAFLSLNSTNV